MRATGNLRRHHHVLMPIDRICPMDVNPLCTFGLSESCSSLDKPTKLHDEWPLAVTVYYPIVRHSMDRYSVEFESGHTSVFSAHELLSVSSRAPLGPAADTSLALFSRSSLSLFGDTPRPVAVRGSIASSTCPVRATCRGDLGPNRQAEESSMDGPSCVRGVHLQCTTRTRMTSLNECSES